MPAGKILTEGELKALKDGTKVYVHYSHPDPQEGQVHRQGEVRHQPDAPLPFTELLGSDFNLDYDYKGDDNAPCTEEGPDGDVLQVHEWVPRSKRKPKPKIVIEVCERSMDYHLAPAFNATRQFVGMERRPKYHAQVKGKTFWGAGTTRDEAIGSLVRNHPEVFGVAVEYLGKLDR
jgi:hypothetical protein